MSHYNPYLDFPKCPKSCPLQFFPHPGPTQASCIAFSCHVSLVFFILEHSPALFFLFRDIDTLEESRPIVCRMFHSLNLSPCFLMIDSGYRFLVQTMLCLSQCRHQEAQDVSLPCFYHMVLTTIDDSCLYQLLFMA